MRAAIRRRYGGPDVIVVNAVPDPSPGRGEHRPVARRLRRRHVRFPLPHGDAALAAHLAGLMDSGAYRPMVDRTYDFDELRDAYAYVDTGRKVGAVVITMPGA